MKRIFITIFFTMALATLVFGPATGSTNSMVLDNSMMPECKPSITGNGSAKNNELLAKSRARDDWRDKARNAYGGHYQYWLNSIGKQLACSRSGGLGNRTWTCAAISQPCLL
jgi:hypothetical protein